MTLNVAAGGARGTSSCGNNGSTGISSDIRSVTLE
ncbi:MAG: hypothetical protein ACJAYU_002624 [Bradymonadia bacterium]|jgi:hypothetical protein